jgi:uncharacterized protein YndB with AHSA1/START domain
LVYTPHRFEPAQFGAPFLAPDVRGPTPAIEFTLAPAERVDGLRARIDVHVDGGELYTPNFADVHIDWGDGTVLRVQPPFDISHDYAAPGVYPIRALVTAPDGRTAMSGVRVQVYGELPAGPAARYVFAPEPPAVGEEVTFDAARSTAGSAGAIATYDWDFRDGTLLPNGGPVVTHTFASADSGNAALDGAYAVHLTVTDAAANTNTVDHYVQVT